MGKISLALNQKTISVANKNKSRYLTTYNLNILALFEKKYKVSGSLLVNVALDEYFAKYSQTPMPIEKGTAISLITSKKGLYLTIDNISKLNHYANEYDVSDSFIINKALNEFFEKYE